MMIASPQLSAGIFSRHLPTVTVTVP